MKVIGKIIENAIAILSLVFILYTILCFINGVSHGLDNISGDIYTYPKWNLWYWLFQK